MNVLEEHHFRTGLASSNMKTLTIRVEKQRMLGKLANNESTRGIPGPRKPCP